MAAYISFQPTDNFKTHLFTGTGASNAQTFPETTAMQPDIVWIKNRDAADFHVFANSISGATKYVETNDSLVQTTNAESVKSFDSDGFTVGTQNEVNTNTEDFVSWNWKMGTTSGIGGSPSITPTAYSFNAAAGQSIIQYTGTGVAGTLPHGLGATPQMIIVRNLAGGYNWMVYHEAMNSAGRQLKLNTSGAWTLVTTIWNNTLPTASLFSVGTNSETNQSADTLLAYCFTSIKGYSKFGKYVGNGNADGTFVYTGFRPSWVLIKAYEDAEGWYMYDDKRAGYNADNNILFANSDSVEDTTDTVDLLSNGFKLRATGGAYNGSGYNYSYSAFAEFPFVSSNSKAGVAR